MFDHGFVERSKLTYNYVRSLSHPLIKPGVYCHPGHRQGRQNPRQCQRRLDKGSESGRQGWQDCGVQNGDESDVCTARLGLKSDLSSGLTRDLFRPAYPWTPPGFAQQYSSAGGSFIIYWVWISYDFITSRCFSWAVAYSEIPCKFPITGCLFFPDYTSIFLSNNPHQSLAFRWLND